MWSASFRGQGFGFWMTFVTSVTLLAPAAEGYEYPSIERGFKPERAFQIGEIDHVRLFNGGLELSIPIGPRYTVGGSLSYGLTLSYSSQVWDYSSASPPPGQTEEVTQAWPVRGANAGLGWRLSLGEYWDTTVIGVGSCRQCYISPDGGRHPFYNTLHPDLADDGPTMYTRDGTYLRLRTVAGGWEIDFPGGEIHKFNSAGKLVQIRDRFNNSVNVTYGATSWTITDTAGRSHTVNLVSVAHYGQAVGSVVLKAFGGTTATYTLTYAQPAVPRSCMDNDPSTPPTMTLPLLTNVALPDGSAYEMPQTSYYLTTRAAPCDHLEYDVPFEGLLLNATLPTRGKVEWAYGAYNFPAPIEGEEGPDPMWLTKTTGVRTRNLLLATGTVHGTWTYTQSLPGGQFAQESITQVSSPLGDRTDYYFRVGDDVDPLYGLPFSTLESPAGRPDLFRSTKVYDCASNGTGCVLKRTQYLKYKTDSPFPGGPEFNPRMEARYTLFHDDGSRWLAEDFSDFDGLGHHRTLVTSGNFPTGNAKTTVVNYNPTRGSYPGSFTMPTPTDPWVLSTFDFRQVTEGGQTAKEEFCFEAANGFLQRSRVLKTGTTRASTDLLAVYTRDASGNATREQRYGSDYGNAGTGVLCSTTLGTEQSRMDHTYQYGVLATSQYFNAGGTSVGFLSLDRTIDQNTGLVSSSRDAALVQTTYAYDSLGRLTTETPAADAATTYLYTRAVGTGKANVRIRRIANGGTAIREETWLYFDHFGRPEVQKRKMPFGALSKRTTWYNALGWVTDISEWESDSGSHTAWTKYRDHDPFGRPLRIEPPDGVAHQIDLTYTGVRIAGRTVRVATGANGVETTAVTTERYDGQGRLYQVVEPAGAAGASITTTYGYDEAGRLASAGTGVQNRTFAYDNRGFLTSECHPEKGATGGGCVTFASYNVFGLAGRKTDGPNDLRYLYDRAGRLVDIEEWGGGQRPLKHWTFGTAVGVADRSRGKVKVAERYNYVFLGTIPYVDLVRETYTYGGLSGRPSSRLTDNFINPTGTSPPSDSYNQSFVWNDLGDLQSQVYPNHLGQPVGRTVSYGYTNGELTSVAGYATSITYHPNGMVNQIGHSNNVTDVWGQDPNKMRRPNFLDSWYAVGTASQSARFISGAYGYDGSGNVETQGTNYFVYDKVSRLVDGRVSTQPGGGGTLAWQTYAYDSFGNITAINTNGTIRNTPTSSSTNRLTSGSYDAAGNLKSYAGGTYEYGPFNDLWHFKNGTEEAVYLYTADDERLWQYQYDLRHQWTVRDLAGKVLREYVYDNPTNAWTVERDYIYRDGTLLAAETPQGIRHFTVDHLGSPRAVTDAAGTRIAYHSYYPFGDEATAAQNTERMKFTGHERDLASPAGTGDDLDYMHARFCSPLTGRFMSVDPKPRRSALGAPQQWNRYSYAVGNPMKYIDSDGEDLFIVYDFAGSGLSDRQQTQVALGVRAAFRRAGVRNVLISFHGGSTKPKLTKPTDRLVHLRVSSEAIRGKGDAIIFGVTPSGSKRATVSLAHAPTDSEARLNFIVNVGSHEVGHASQALPKYANDQFPIGSWLNPEGAEPGTIMQQGASAEELGAEPRDFSQEDAEKLREILNEDILSCANGKNNGTCVPPL